MPGRKAETQPPRDKETVLVRYLHKARVGGSTLKTQRHRDNTKENARRSVVALVQPAAERVTRESVPAVQVFATTTPTPAITNDTAGSARFSACTQDLLAPEKGKRDPLLLLTRPLIPGACSASYTRYAAISNEYCCGQATKQVSSEFTFGYRKARHAVLGPTWPVISW